MLYSTQQENFVISEYGRNVRRMVDYALTITDKEERNRCVQTIIRTMENVSSSGKSEAERNKLYDHLALLSGFRLDIDYPYQRPSQEEPISRPERMPYNTERHLRFRHYGRVLQELIDEAVRENNTERQHQLIIRIANRMKQNSLVWNKEHADEQHIKDDIRLLSNGQLNCEFPEFQLLHSRQLNPQNDNNSSGKKKKHKKK